MTHTNPLLLTDESLEECADGATDPRLLREILSQSAVVQRDKKVDVKQFAKYFQIALEDLAENEESSENNYEWGLSIAENINDKTLQRSNEKQVTNPKDAWPKP